MSSRSHASHLHVSYTCLESSVHINPQLWTNSSNRVPSTESSSIGLSQLYVKKNSHSASITNKVSYSQLKYVLLIRSRAPHHTPVPPSPPHHLLEAPWVSIPIDRCSEGLLMAKNRRGKQTEQSRGVSFITQHPEMAVD